MLKNCLFACLLFVCCSCYTQQLSQVTFTQATDFAWFSLVTNQHILIRISAEGKILEYGNEQASVNNRNYFAPKLIAAGTVNYYQHETDSSLNGKIKNIGSCFFTYYGMNDYPERAGKLKSAGSLSFDYYRKYENPQNTGKLKIIGTNAINFYGLNDNEAYRGKLKAIGNTGITYYSSFDNLQLKGKLKSIGNYILNWGTTNNGREFIPYLKTNNGRELINGTTYILQ